MAFFTVWNLMLAGLPLCTDKSEEAAWVPLDMANIGTMLSLLVVIRITRCFLGDLGGVYPPKPYRVRPCLLRA